ncbi:hypothetical protein PVAP13_2KG512510 [Panicum virgatum]|uniref:Uncharacterized protein n=1 Tax=Panicum virgatum TaxID=38727 RepID=A0A8T0WGP7_PANVG|nr:hypothetical protein PVAP13_2KG512510 [Panicum virgatum]
MGHESGAVEEPDDFDEFDPTPYDGGYDLFVTYGRPLPPSKETCHPCSAPSSTRPTAGAAAAATNPARACGGADRRGSFPTASRHGSGDALAQETVQEQGVQLDGHPRQEGEGVGHGGAAGASRLALGRRAQVGVGAGSARGRQGYRRADQDTARRSHMGAACGGPTASQSRRDGATSAGAMRRARRARRLGIQQCAGTCRDGARARPPSARASNRAAIGDPNAMERDEGEKAIRGRRRLRAFWSKIF